MEVFFMNKNDHVEKLLEDCNDVFADIYNTLLFRKPLLKEDFLQFGPTESIYKNDSNATAEQRRDVLKIYQNQVNLVISSFGIENQSSYDKYMPIRIMGYDAGSYNQQVKNVEKKKVIYPVITIVLNFSNRPWKEIKDLHSLLTIPDELKPFVKNYEITVFDIAFLEDDVINEFTSDFKAIARFFKDRRLNKNALADNTVELKYPSAVTEFLAVFTNDSWYRDINDLIMESQKKGERITMCNVAQAIAEKGIEKGISQGIEQGRAETLLEAIRNLMGSMKLTPEQAMAALSVPENEYGKYIELLKKSTPNT